MKRILTFIFGGCLSAAAWAGPNTIPLYENWSTVTNVPQIDALAFVNYGEFFVSTSGDPYDFMNVLNYTNRNFMEAIPGFLFNHIDDNGVRSPAEQFINEVGATVQADPLLLLRSALLPPTPSLLRIEADRVVNRGDLLAYSDGAIKVRGREVDLSRGAIGVTPLLFGTGFQGTTNYIPDEGVYDQFWGLGEQDPRFTSSSVVQGFGAALQGNAPVHNVTNTFFGTPVGMGNAFTLPDPLFFVHTNEVDPTNWTVQVVLVTREDPKLNLQVNFFPSTQPTNAFFSPAVQFESPLTNNLQGWLDSTAVYLVDRLAAETNFTVLTNDLTQGYPYRPSTYEFTRNRPLEFALGEPPQLIDRTNVPVLVYNPGGLAVTNITTNYTVTPVPPNGTNLAEEIVTNIVLTAGYTHDLVTNLYAGYGVFFTNLINVVPDVPNASLTNAPGRVEIVADSLNLERARIRGEGNVTVKANHLVSTKLLSMDVPYLTYDVASTNGSLTLESLAPPEIQRLAGSIQAWSAVWTNSLNIITNVITNSTITNITIDTDGNVTETVTNDPGTNIFTTNTINVGVHVMLVDAAPTFWVATAPASPVRSRWPTFITGIQALSTNIYVADPTRVLERLLFRNETLEIGPEGGLFLGDSMASNPNWISDWKAEHFPSLTTLTNRGLINVPHEMLLGVDRDTPYDRVVISGTNAAFTHRYRVHELVNSGLIVSGQLFSDETNTFVQPRLGPIQIEADKITLDGGRIGAGADLQITANDLKLRHSTNTAVRALYLNVSDSLNDNGGDAEVLFASGLGMHLDRKPTRGDLLGTSFELSAGRFQYVESTWAAEDRGPTAEGFVDNVAIGRLLIDPPQDATLALAGAGERNGMYVDYLEFGPSAVADLANAFVVDSNLTVYFASASLDASILTNAFPGRLVWVRDFVGPRSGVDVVLPSGESIRINRGVRESAVIDSDADGTANGFDLSPFGGVRITDFSLADGTAVLTWRAAVGTRYEVQATSSLSDPAWEVVGELTNTGDDIALLTIEDPATPGTTEHYYRVVYFP